MKGPDVRAQAKNEMVREKHRILRIKGEVSSPLEKVAFAWKKKKEAEEREKQKERVQKEPEQSFDFQKFLAQQIEQHDKEKRHKETGWSQYNPLQKEENEKKEISINMSTVRALAKRLIAREWARILGKPQNHQFDSLEREAGCWEKRKDIEEKRKKEARLKMSRQKKILKESLHQFGQKLRQERDTLKPEEAAALFEEMLKNAGEILDVEWHKKGCYIWLEPWEEKKNRRISGDTLPVVHRAFVDQSLDLASYQRADKEGIRHKMREAILYKPLQGLLIKDEEEAEEVLEEVLSKIGQIIELKRTKKGWIASFEPWEKVRLRNIKNKGKGPAVSTLIEINWSKGKFSIAS